LGKIGILRVRVRVRVRVKVRVIERGFGLIRVGVKG
jgi:hypothetical protein